jgi:hypothetical protein
MDQPVGRAKALFHGCPEIGAPKHAARLRIEYAQLLGSDHIAFEVLAEAEIDQHARGVGG